MSGYPQGALTLIAPANPGGGWDQTAVGGLSRESCATAAFATLIGLALGTMGLQITSLMGTAITIVRPRFGGVS